MVDEKCLSVASMSSFPVDIVLLLEISAKRLQFKVELVYYSKVDI